MAIITMNHAASEIFKFLVILTIVSGFSAFLVLGGTKEVDAKVISLNRTAEEVVYANPPFVETGIVYYYDVRVGNEIRIVSSGKELVINSTIKIRS